METLDQVAGNIDSQPPEGIFELGINPALIETETLDEVAGNIDSQPTEEIFELGINPAPPNQAEVVETST